MFYTRMLFSLLLICVTFGSISGELIKYTHMKAEYIINSEECPAADACTPGLQCSSDCSTVQLCAQLSNGNYALCNVNDCSSLNNATASYHCNSNTHACDPKPVQCPTAFQCNDQGTFPDLYNCSVFHTCSADGTDIPDQCGPNQKFDIGLRRCSNAGNCVQLPQCSNPGECKMLADSNDDIDGTIFYICLQNSDNKQLLHPALFNCDLGSVNSTTCICEESSLPSDS